MKDNSINYALLAVLRSPSTRFSDLAKVSPIDLKRDFVGANLSGVDLRGENLTAFNFTGATFHGALVEGAIFNNTVTRQQLSQTLDAFIRNFADGDIILRIPRDRETRTRPPKNIILTMIQSMQELFSIFVPHLEIVTMKIDATNKGVDTNILIRPIYSTSTTEHSDDEAIISQIYVERLSLIVEKMHEFKDQHSSIHSILRDPTDISLDRIDPFVAVHISWLSYLCQSWGPIAIQSKTVAVEISSDTGIPAQKLIGTAMAQSDRIRIRTGQKVEIQILGEGPDVVYCSEFRPTYYAAYGSANILVIGSAKKPLSLNSALSITLFDANIDELHVSSHDDYERDFLSWPSLSGLYALQAPDRKE